jgi:A/G-specific adenine glycosylase
MTTQPDPAPALRSLVKALLEWYGRHARDLPWRRTRDPYAIWVSEVMLQQTQVKTVIPFWERWMREFPDVMALAEAPEDRVLKLWEGLGYYRRVRSLHQAARQLKTSHGGRFPQDYETVLELPGVGRYTAGAICSIAFGQAVPILDGNIIRVFCRLGALAGDPKDPERNRVLWDQATRWVETAAASGKPEACSHLNQALMELGATVCTPRDPSCERCPLSVGCQARVLGRVEAFPELAARAKPTAREFVVAVIEHRGRVWVRQRAGDALNGGLWEFPNLEVEPGAGGGDERLKDFLGEKNLEGWKSLTVVRHAITRYRVTQRAFTLDWVGDVRGVPGGGRWCRREELEAFAMSSAHRRIAHAWSQARDELHPD